MRKKTEMERKGEREWGAGRERRGEEGRGALGAEHYLD